MSDAWRNSGVSGLQALTLQGRDVVNDFRGARCRFERASYFCVDRASSPAKLVFNRTATLRDTWAKIEKKTKGGK